MKNETQSLALKILRQEQDIKKLQLQRLRVSSFENRINALLEKVKSMLNDKK